MALPLKQQETEESRPPCDVCGRPRRYNGFWGKALCESCWLGWKDTFDAEFTRLGGKSPAEPGILFEQWFATAKVKARAA